MKNEYNNSIYHPSLLPSPLLLLSTVLLDRN